MKYGLTIRLITATTLITLASCGKAYELYEVDGVSEKFCVPKQYVVPNIPWVPPDSPETPKGFAFKSCWRGDLVASKECVFPKTVQGGFIAPTQSFTGWGWRRGDFSGSHIYDIALKKDSLLEIEDEGATVVVSNSKRDWNWYVWRKAKPLVEDGKPYLADDDELVATCQTNDVALPGKHETRKMIACDRYVRGKEYILKYSFESNERVPHDLEKLDAQVFAQLDRWRCKK